MWITIATIYDVSQYSMVAVSDYHFVKETIHYVADSNNYDEVMLEIEGELIKKERKTQIFRD